MSDAPPVQPLYCAFGRVYGTYQPDADNFLYGTFLTPDGCQFPASLNRSLLKQLGMHYRDRSDQKEVFDEPHLWSIYPRTSPDVEQPLRFNLTRLRKTPAPETLAVLSQEFLMTNDLYHSPWFMQQFQRLIQ